MHLSSAAAVALGASPVALVIVGAVVGALGRYRTAMALCGAGVALYGVLAVWIIIARS